MKRVSILSDTHLSSETLPRWVREQIRDTDHTIHAGDVDTVSGLQLLRRLSDGQLTAARGNWDRSLSQLPIVATINVDEFSFIVTHGTTGAINDYDRRVLIQAQNHGNPALTKIAISGHTHRYRDTLVENVRLLNPGSATGVYPARTATMIVVEISGDELTVSKLQNGQVTSSNGAGTTRGA